MSQIVIEFGSAFIRAGVAGESVPRIVVPVCDEDALLFRKGSGEELRLRVLELFSQIFPFVTARRAKETRILLLENATERRELRNTIAEVLFRYFKVDYLCLYPSFFLSVVPTGLRTAVLVDVGRAETRAVAVFDGRVLLPTLTTAPVGWSTLLNENVQGEQGTEATADRDDRVLRNIEQSLLTEGAEQPDSLRELVGSGVWAHDEFRGVAGVLLDCLLKCPLDVLPAVARHVVYGGGVSSIAGFTSEVAKVAMENVTRLDRYSSLRQPLQNQTSARGVPALSAEVVCFPAHLLAWVGGSLLGSCRGIASRFVREADTRHATDGSIDMPDWLSTNPEDWRFLAPTV